jgi:hypothetical protein
MKLHLRPVLQGLGTNKKKSDNSKSPENGKNGCKRVLQQIKTTGGRNRAKELGSGVVVDDHDHVLDSQGL